MGLVALLKHASRASRVRAAVLGIIGAVFAALAIGFPTRLIANRWFSRMTPTRTQDYIFLIVSSLLIGATVGLVSLGNSISTQAPTKALASGGIGTVFAAGCPICNKLVVAVLGTSGALRYFAPVQPILGALSIGGLTWALHKQYRSVVNPWCVAQSNQPGYGT